MTASERARYKRFRKCIAVLEAAEKIKQEVIKADIREPEEKRQREEASSSSGCTRKIVDSDRLMSVQEPERNELKRAREDGAGDPVQRDAHREMEGEDDKMDVNLLQWWDFGDKAEEDGEERAIHQVELEEHMADIWERVGGDDLERWVAKVKRDMDEREECEKERSDKAWSDYEWAWDDVHGGEIRLSDLRMARKEEVDFMEKRQIWSEKPVSEPFLRRDSAAMAAR